MAQAQPVRMTFVPQVRVRASVKFLFCSYLLKETIRLTYHLPDVDSHGDRPATGGASEGAPLLVVFTRQMLEAGADRAAELYDSSPMHQAEEIFLVMARAAGLVIQVGDL